jgi:ectoine hydroxylase-related dioxygenase (phytanoyl-CoA dioxygenase family)
VPDAPRRKVVWFSTAECCLDDLRAVVEAGLAGSVDPSSASRVEHGVPVYDGEMLRDAADVMSARRSLQGELVTVMLEGPGVLAVERAFADLAVVTRATDVYASLVAAERAMDGERGDHFAKAGTNDRLWDALGKLALADPSLFADYFANEVVALVSEAWLGPGYEVTAQLNVVNPGGAAQEPHRDYHLGFFPPDVATRYPAHVHALSPLLTLQGAIAHVDMPLEAGPTSFLPHSQKYRLGYIAAGLEEFRQYVAAHSVQLPLRAGDALFFNPALFHAAGHNASAGVRRMANLLQVSSPFGRPTEAVDRSQVLRLVYPVLLERRLAGVAETTLRNVVAAAAEGYPFPLNLDRLPPLHALAPPSQRDVVWQALHEAWSPGRLEEEL